MVLLKSNRKVVIVVLFGVVVYIWLFSTILDCHKEYVLCILRGSFIFPTFSLPILIIALAIARLLFLLLQSFGTSSKQRRRENNSS